MIFAIYQCYRINSHDPKVMRINQAYEVTDCNQLYAKNSNKSLRKDLWCLAGSFTQPCTED